MNDLYRPSGFASNRFRMRRSGPRILTNGRRHVDDASVDAATNATSFSGFYRSERKSLVYAVGLALGDHDLGCEVVDNALAKAYQRWHEVRQQGTPAAWVYRTAMNEARDRFRRRSRDRKYAAQVASVEATYENYRAIGVLDDAIASLTDDHRAVIVCRYFLDWDIATTSEALGLTPNTTKSRTRRALNVLQKSLQ